MRKPCHYPAAYLLAILAIVLPFLPRTAQAADPVSPLNVDAGYFGINAERPHEDVYNSDLLSSPDSFSGSGSIEATVSIRDTAADDASAGLAFQNFYFGIYPNEGKWRLYQRGGDPLEGDYGIGLDPQSCKLKVEASGDSIAVSINDATVATLKGVAPAGGGAGLFVRYTDAGFSGVAVSGTPQDLSTWTASHTVAWSGITGSSARGNVLLDPVLLSSPQLSPKLDARFRMLDEMGARYVRFVLSWAEIQPQGSEQPYSWRYADAFAIAAQRNNLDIVPVAIFMPRWAVKPEVQGLPDYFAYPPVDSNGNFDATGFSRFVAAATDRYRQGGRLAALMNWAPGSHGQADYLEIGPEFNSGAYYEKKNGQWETNNAGWLGSLAQYVDLLKAGHDAVKSVCPACLVVSGAAADDTIPNYYIGDDPSRYDGYEPYLDSTRLLNPDGTLAWRQTVWQGVDDLYREIEQRPAPDNTPGRYFDVLNIHTFMWKGLTSEWPSTVDRFVSCSFYSSDCWRQWYRTRLEEVTRVMHEHNDNRDIWLSETGFASAPPANDYLGFLGFLSEDKQAQALQTAYAEAAGFPEVKKVFWWQGYDSGYTGYLGLIRDDLTAKPSYEKYAWMTGKQFDFRARDVFSWYDGIGAADWVLMADPSSAAGDAWFDLSLAGEAKGLPSLPGLAPGQVPAGAVLSVRYPGVIGGPVNVSYNSPSQAVTSQRILWAGKSLEEVVGTESTRLSNHFFWPWYDEQSPGYKDWVLVSNPGSAPVYYRIRIAGSDMASGSITPGGIVTRRFPHIMNGPVEVQAWSDAIDGMLPAEVMASQRVLSNGDTAFNELPGIPAAELASDYYWTWYDMKSAGAADWVLIANPPGAAPIYYEIKIGGRTASGGPIHGGGIETPIFPGQMDGPVEVRTFADEGHTIAANSIASQRAVWGPSFEEVPGYPAAALSSGYFWTWYDESAAHVKNWVLVANPGAGTIWYQVFIAGTAQKACAAIGPGGRDTPDYSGVMGGPVEVRAYTDPDCSAPASGPAIMASQRVLWNGYFNEVPGVSIISR